MDNESLGLTVTFHGNFEVNEAVTKVSHLDSPDIVIWYIGTSGLKESCARFYQREIIDPILTNSSRSIFWLVDLTAWSALKDKNSSISNYSSISEKINGFCDFRIKCFKSSDFFGRIECINNIDFISYFQRALSRNSLWINSKDFKDNDIYVKDVFGSNCNLMSVFNDRMASKSYSMLQYLEGCFIIEEIVMENVLIRKKSDIQIVFLLPNDETKYYQCDSESFIKDIRFTLLNSLRDLFGKLKISVDFFSFNYGESSICRPYNSRGKNLRKNELNLRDITLVNS